LEKTLSAAAFEAITLGDEAPDTRSAGSRGELFEQPRSDPAPLLVIGDGERHLAISVSEERV